MKFKKQKMVNWYDVEQLCATGLKTVVSSVFGNFADKRETLAALNMEQEFYDYSQKEELWVDYIADVGDGFNSTYSMAHLLAKDSLDLDGDKAPRGRVLIMGGDQVYPTPEMEEYKNRLQGPYNAAYPWKDGDDERPHLFAIPGNHDWYDGLSNFIKLFCQRRAFGNWHTQQSRSYFALKLPHNVWVWGVDIQLQANIDKPQQDYFDNLAKTEMEPGDKVILCTAEPSWVHNSINRNDTSYRKLDYFVNKYVRKNELTLLATISGDLHHYARYEVKNKDHETEQMITAGGGGAFMHPTHVLKDELTKQVAPESELKSVYPEKSVSRKMAYKNLLFPFIGKGVSFFLGVFFLFTTWLLQSTTNHDKGGSMMEVLSDFSYSLENVHFALVEITKTLFLNPVLLFLNLTLFVGILKFTDTDHGKGKWNLVAGIIHATLQVNLLYVLLWVFSRLNLHHLEMELGGWQVALFCVQMLVFGSLIGGFIFGLYLLISTLVFGNHPTEAFSSMQITGFKNFLRIKVSKDEVTIYPVGVNEVVCNWKNVGSEEKPIFQGDEIKYHLIEKPVSLPLKKQVNKEEEVLV